VNPIAPRARYLSVLPGEVLALKVAGRGGNNDGNTSPGDGGWG